MTTAQAITLEPTSNKEGGATNASFGVFNTSAGRFVLPSLPFLTTALAPVTNEETLETHLGQHHKAYVDGANKHLDALSKKFDSAEAVIAFARDTDNQPLFEQAAQALNHAFFWTCQQAAGHTRPVGALEAAINDAFGDFDGFIEQAVKLGKARVGSGWLWLTGDSDGRVSLSTTIDTDTLLDDDTQTALVVCDIWEHAFYLDHKSEKAKWIESYFSQIVDWELAGQRFSKLGSSS